MKLYLILILSIAGVLSSNICEDEFFLMGRNPDNCRNHFMCMLGTRIDFWCLNGEIFDLDRRACRPGDDATCEYIITPVPDDACMNDFFAIRPHPDRFECERFFVCMNYNTIEFRCDPGFVFGLESLSCEPGNLRNCN